MPSGAPDYSGEAFRNAAPEDALDRVRPLLARPVTTAAWRTIRIGCPTASPGRRQSPLFHPSMHLLAIILTGGLFLLLAGKASDFTGCETYAPATQELANGNLSVRVVPAMGNRRDELAFARRRLSI